MTDMQDALRMTTAGMKDLREAFMLLGTIKGNSPDTWVASTIANMEQRYYQFDRYGMAADHAHMVLESRYCMQCSATDAVLIKNFRNGVMQEVCRSCGQEYWTEISDGITKLYHTNQRRMGQGMYTAKLGSDLLWKNFAPVRSMKRGRDLNLYALLTAQRLRDMWDALAKNTSNRAIAQEAVRHYKFKLTSHIPVDETYPPDVDDDERIQMILSRQPDPRAPLIAAFNKRFPNEADAPEGHLRHMWMALNIPVEHSIFARESPWAAASEMASVIRQRLADKMDRDMTADAMANAMEQMKKLVAFKPEPQPKAWQAGSKDSQFKQRRK